MAPSATCERVRKLERKKVIQSYETRVDPKALGKNMTAFVLVRTDETAGDYKTAEALMAIPEIIEIHIVAGEDCYLTKVRTTDAESLSKLLRNKIGAIPTVRSTRSTVVLETYKETINVPIEEESDED
jgi:Lrp/AsnC family leucine-responsive transcriptional regulator